MRVQYKDNIITVGSLRAKVFRVTFFDSNVKPVYEDIKAKPAYNKADLVLLRTKLVFGLEHIIGIMKIINERKQRNITSDIKNVEIEFLMRVCCTDQISEALRINFGDKSEKDFVVMILSDEYEKLIKIGKEFERYGTVMYDNNNNSNYISKKNKNSVAAVYHGPQDNSWSLIPADNLKRDYIIDLFFKEKIKDNESQILRNNTEFLKFLIERAAISLK